MNKEDTDFNIFFLNKLKELNSLIDDINIDITNKSEILINEFKKYIEDIKNYFKEFSSEIEKSIFLLNISKKENLINNTINKFKKLKISILFENNYSKTINELYKKIDKIDYLINDIYDISNLDLPNINSFDLFNYSLNINVNRESIKSTGDNSNNFQRYNSYLKLCDNLNYNEVKNSEITFNCPICLNNEVICFCEHCNNLYCEKCLNDIQNNGIEKKHNFIYIDIKCKNEKRKTLFLNSINSIIKSILLKSDYLFSNEKIIMKEPNSDNNYNKIKCIKRVIDYPFIEENKNDLDSQLNFLKKINEIIENNFNKNILNNLNKDNFQISRIDKRIIYSIKNIFIDKYMNLFKENLKKIDDDYYSVSDFNFDENSIFIRKYTKEIMSRNSTIKYEEIIQKKNTRVII